MATNAPPQWPGVNKPFAHKDLGRHLFRVASLHARRALTAATNDLEILDRAFSVGTSIELLAKSALAHINPVLLAADRDSRHLLHFAGIASIDPSKTKTRIAADCLTVLNQVHAFDYRFDRDQHVFEVRNLAVHLGCIDAQELDRALTTMVALSEQIISIVEALDSTHTRSTFWTTDFLAQVDERLKAQAEARRLKLEQLKAAALREIERLRARGLDDDVLTELADHAPPSYYEYAGRDPDDAFERHECPVCKFEGWVEYSETRGPVQYDYSDDNGAPLTSVDVEWDPAEFYCGVCSLRLGDDLLFLAAIGESRYETEEATEAELLAAEEAAMDDYWESMREDEKWDMTDPDEHKGGEAGEAPDAP